MSFILSPGDYPDVFVKPTTTMKSLKLATAVSSSIPSGFGITELSNGDFEITVANGTTASTNIGNTAFVWFPLTDALTGKDYVSADVLNCQDNKLFGFEVISTSSTNSGVEILGGWGSAINSVFNASLGGVWYDPAGIGGGNKTVVWRWINTGASFTRQAAAAVPGTPPIGWLNVCDHNTSAAALITQGNHLTDAYAAKVAGSPWTPCSTNSGIALSSNLGVLSYAVLAVRPNSNVTADQTFVIRPYKFEMKWPF